MRFGPSQRILTVIFVASLQTAGEHFFYLNFDKAPVAAGSARVVGASPHFPQSLSLRDKPLESISPPEFDPAPVAAGSAHVVGASPYFPQGLSLRDKPLEASSSPEFDPASVAAALAGIKDASLGARQ